MSWAALHEPVWNFVTGDGAVSMICAVYIFLGQGQGQGQWNKCHANNLEAKARGSFNITRVGSGSRGFLSGAGETELELQRRRISERRMRLLAEIEEVRRTRALQRASRKKRGCLDGQGLATVAVVGHTNAGKSALVSVLSDSDLYSDDRLFATVNPRVRSVALPTGTVLLSDTMGFISDFPMQLVEAFHATLEEVVEANLLVAGPFVSPTHKALLDAPYAKWEIELSLLDMEDDRDPGPDGYTALFFKKAWPVIGEDVSQTVLEFLNNDKLLSEINRIVVSLIPKVSQARRVGDFRPISYCNVLYKLISKVLPKRLQTILPDIVSNSQNAFVKGRHISDNIMLTQEILFGYERKGVSPRCLAKIEVYDSVEWEFISNLLTGLQFPASFVRQRPFVEPISGQELELSYFS
ncbi:GTP-binding protein, chloroplastic-like protein [Drosera capensis]